MSRTSVASWTAYSLGILLHGSFPKTSVKYIFFFTPFNVGSWGPLIEFYLESINQKMEHKYVFLLLLYKFNGLWREISPLSLGFFGFVLFCLKVWVSASHEGLGHKDRLWVCHQMGVSSLCSSSTGLRPWIFGPQFSLTGVPHGDKTCLLSAPLMITVRVALPSKREAWAVY